MHCQQINSNQTKQYMTTSLWQGRASARTICGCCRTFMYLRFENWLLLNSVAKNSGLHLIKMKTSAL